MKLASYSAGYGEEAEPLDPDRDDLPRASLKALKKMRLFRQLSPTECETHGMDTWR